VRDAAVMLVRLVRHGEIRSVKVNAGGDIMNWMRDANG